MQKTSTLKIVLPIVLVPLLLMGCDSFAPIENHSHSQPQTESPGTPETPNQRVLVINIDPTHIHCHPVKKNIRWLSPQWNNLTSINQLLDAIRKSSWEGLNPDDYHLESIEACLQRTVLTDTSSMADWIQLDLLLTDACRLLASHLANGKTDKKTADPYWHAAGRDITNLQKTNPDSILKSGMVTPRLFRLTPHHREYLNLKRALVRYRKIEKMGGWKPFVTQKTKIEKGMTLPEVALLRRRLAVEQGAIKPDTDDDNLFDQTLLEQVMVFQQRNSLIADGVIGKLSIDALNVPVDQRIRTIEANLERWRWLTDQPGHRHILVNIANFSIQMIDRHRSIFTSQAIVGRPLRETPVFSSLMTYLVLNPDWTVPPTILNEDVIPEVINNPSYLSNKQMRVIAFDGSEVDPAIIDWNRATLSGFPYMIRQNPGSLNSLGRVKFMFPNPYNIYIHDTPARSLFLRNERTFSSGCIRINKPLELALLLMDEQPDINAEKISEMLESGVPKTITLKQPVPIHIVYLTAWADDNGIAGFGNDVYHRDEPLIQALSRK